MIIYGVALLSLCTLAGLFIGEILGVLLGVPANVGGVGIAMLLLIFVGSYLGKRGLLSAKTEQGVEFWSAVYIPIVVAMAAQQNVLGALSGGRPLSSPASPRSPWPSPWSRCSTASAGRKPKAPRH